jgi:hypothetical protein
VLDGDKVPESTIAKIVKMTLDQHRRGRGPTFGRDLMIAPAMGGFIVR